MKRMAIITITPEGLRKLLNLPDNMTFVEARIPFDQPGVMEIKVEGAGWETPEGAMIAKAPPAIMATKEDGTLDIDWNVPT